MSDSKAAEYGVDLNNLFERVGTADRRMSSFNVLVQEAVKVTWIQGFTKGEDDESGGFTLTTPLGAVEIRPSYTVEGGVICPVALISRRDTSRTPSELVPIGVIKMPVSGKAWTGVFGDPLETGKFDRVGIETGIAVLEDVAAAQMRSYVKEAAAYE